MENMHSIVFFILILSSILVTAYFLKRYMLFKKAPYLKKFEQDNPNLFAKYYPSTKWPFGFLKIFLSVDSSLLLSLSLFWLLLEIPTFGTNPLSASGVAILGLFLIRLWIVMMDGFGDWQQRTETGDVLNIAQRYGETVGIFTGIIITFVGYIFSL